MSEAHGETSRTRGCVLVLGMHRSGTSALAGMLSLLGCATPASLIHGDRNNEKGYFESDAIGRLSDEIMDACGSQWSDWRPLEINALDADRQRAFGARASQIIASDFSDSSLFVVKEPRMCRMVALWLDAIETAGVTPHIVHTHRNPNEVAASLARRDGFDQAFSFLMWLRHVLDAEYSTRGQKRVFCSYRQLMRNWQDVADRISEGLVLKWPLHGKETTEAVSGFLSKRLRHYQNPADQTIADPALPEGLRETFAIMERWASTGEERDDYITLDRIRAALDADTVTFAPLVRPGQMAMLERDKLVQTLEELGQAQEDASERIAALEAVLGKTREDASERIAALEAVLGKAREDASERIAALEAVLGRAQEDARERIGALNQANSVIGTLRSSLSGREDQVHDLQSVLDQTRAENDQLHQKVTRAEHGYQALLHSRSWRLTAPLRWAIRLVRRP